MFHISSFGEQVSTQGETSESAKYSFEIEFLSLWDTQDHKMNLTFHAPTLPFSTSISLLRLPQLHTLCPHSRIFGWRLRNDRISIYCFSVFDMSCREPAKYFYLGKGSNNQNGNLRCFLPLGVDPPPPSCQKWSINFVLFIRWLDD